MPLYPNGPLWSQCLSPDLLAKASLQDIVAKATSGTMSSIIDFRLPPINANAGGVLRHAVQTLESLFKKHSPVIFKVGYTHDPIWRWTNRLYGYHSSRDNFANMTVLYVSDEPYSAAMLEASLIEKYCSTLTSEIVTWIYMCQTFPQRWFGPFFSCICLIYKFTIIEIISKLLSDRSLSIPQALLTPLSCWFSKVSRAAAMCDLVGTTWNHLIRWMGFTWSTSSLDRLLSNHMDALWDPELYRDLFLK